VRLQRLHEAGHLINTLALDPQACDESGDLGRSRAALEHIVEGSGSLVRAQVLAAQDLPEDRRPSAQARKGCQRHASLPHAAGAGTPRALNAA